MSEADWRSTLEAAAGGDAAARNQLIERYADRVRSRVHAELEQDFRRNHRWILPLFSTRDVVQDVFVAVIRSLSAGERDQLDFPSEHAFIAWLSTVCRNRLLDGGMARIAEFPQYDHQGRWLIEGNGVAPDIEVDNLPYETAKGGDAQLDRGIAELLARLQREPIPDPAAQPLPVRGTPAHDGSR